MVPVTRVEPAFLVAFPTTPSTCLLLSILCGTFSVLWPLSFFPLCWMTFHSHKGFMQDTILGFKHEFAQVNVYLFYIYYGLRHYGIELGSTAFRIRPDSTRQRNWFVVLPMVESSPQPAWTGNLVRVPGKPCTLFYRPTHSGAWAESKASSPFSPFAGQNEWSHQDRKCSMLSVCSCDLSPQTWAFLALGMFLLHHAGTALPTADHSAQFWSLMKPDQRVWTTVEPTLQLCLGRELSHQSLTAVSS